MGIALVPQSAPRRRGPLTILFFQFLGVVSVIGGCPTHPKWGQDINRPLNDNVAAITDACEFKYDVEMAKKL